MIDSEGFRPNVGIVILNQSGQVFWAKRVHQNAWQFPQGGIHAGEAPEKALYRELYEEVGLEKSSVELITGTSGWLRYRLPKNLLRHRDTPVCIGQKQKWFLLRLLSNDAAIDLATSINPEFDQWQWASYWYPIDQVVTFKRDVYRRVLKEFVRYTPL